MHVVFDASDLKDNVYPENARPHNLKTALFELYLKTPSADYISPSGKREIWKAHAGQPKLDQQKLSEVKDIFSKRVTECFRAEATLAEVRVILLDLAKFMDQI